MTQNMLAWYVNLRVNLTLRASILTLSTVTDEPESGDYARVQAPPQEGPHYDRISQG